MTSSIHGAYARDGGWRRTECTPQPLLWDAEVFFLFFVFGYTGSLVLPFVAALGTFSTDGKRGYSSFWCPGFLLQWLLLLQGIGWQAQELWSTSLLHDMWDLSGIKPVSPALSLEQGWEDHPAEYTFGQDSVSLKEDILHLQNGAHWL